MTAVIEPRSDDSMVDAAALECVHQLLDATMLRDLGAVLATLDDDVQVRVGGSVVANGRDEVASLVAVTWRTQPEATVTVLDTHVADGSVYVRSQIRADDAYVGYSIVDTRGGHVHEISTFVSPVRRHPAPAMPTDAVLDLRRDEPSVDLRGAPIPAPDVAPSRRFLLPIAAIGSWLVQDLLLAAPVVATAASIGSWRAFAIFAPAYVVLSLVLSLATVRLLRDPCPPAEGRVARWLAQSRDHPGLQRWLKAGSVFGFVLTSYVLSGPPTVWALHRLGVRRGLWRFAVLASVTWGVTFVVSYLITAEVASFLL